MAGGIVDSITGAIGWATSPVYDAVRRLVDGVVGWISDWVHHVIDWAGRAFDDVWGFARSLNDWAHEAAGWIADEWGRVSGWINGAVDRIRSVVGGWIDDVYAWGVGELNKVYAYARRTVDDMWQWAFDHVVRPIADAAGQLFTDLWHTVVPWVSTLVDGVRGWAGDMFRWVIQHAEDLIRPVVDAVTPVIRIVAACWGWLAWIATHPYDWWIRLWHGLADRSPHVVEDMVARSVESNAQWLEDAVVRWLE